MSYWYHCWPSRKKQLLGAVGENALLRSVVTILKFLLVRRPIEQACHLHMLVHTLRLPISLEMPRQCGAALLPRAQHKQLGHSASSFDVAIISLPPLTGPSSETSKMLTEATLPIMHR
jgi:hypothetical protein